MRTLQRVVFVLAATMGLAAQNAEGYGLANLEHGVANRPETKFRLGSIAKQFTAAAILQLVERGKMKVEDRIANYVPGSPAAWSEVTIHHLLTHTSGIPSYTDGKAYGARMRERVGSPLEFVPGERFRYLSRWGWRTAVTIGRQSL